jgi:hypothetical protein
MAIVFGSIDSAWKWVKAQTLGLFGRRRPA